MRITRKEMERMAHKKKYAGQSRERDFRKKLGLERELFRMWMLSKDSAQVYDKCNKIRFFEILFEFFDTRRRIDKQTVEAGLRAAYLMEELYQVYLTYEWLEISTEEDIAGLIGVYVELKRRDGRTGVLRWDGMRKAGWGME